MNGHRQRQRPHGLALGLLLEGDGEHPLVDARPARAGRPRSRSSRRRDPAVCTRNSGLPVAPSASARYSSGIITPSKKSGALPITTASMSAQVISASSSAREAASRTRPAIETSPRVAWCLVWPTPTTATRSLPISPLPSRTHTRFCCRHGPEVAWATPRSAVPSMMRWATSPMRMRPAAIIGLAASAPPEGLTLTWSPQARAPRGGSAPGG